MPSLTPIETIHRWLHLLIRCDPTTAEQLLDKVEASLDSARWRRGTKEEARLKQSASVPGLRCFVRLDPDDTPRISLWLFVDTSLGIKGGNLIPLKDESDFPAKVAEAADEFLHKYVEPTAKAFNLTVGTDRPGPLRDRLPYQTQQALGKFLDALPTPARGLTADDLRRWEAFVVAAYRDDAIVDPAELRAELHTRLPAELADERVDAFSEGIMLLSSYDQARRSA